MKADLPPGARVPFPTPPFPRVDDAMLVDAARVMAGQVAGTLRVAAALAEAGRQIDLDGLERMIGRLCARAVDLPPAQGRALRPVLVDLLAQLDALGTRLAPD